MLPLIPQSIELLKVAGLTINPPPWDHLLHMKQLWKELNGEKSYQGQLEKRLFTDECSVLLNRGSVGMWTKANKIPF